ncbi:hypothetical protein DTO013E5_5859 [Penicillium roqueforti]|uniref:Nicotinamide N-methyltransferase-like n=1 Tax=Penicillium roqueforti (strain FM164) TaxID=1365484 RepID=W6Q4N7_PENRF|nr:uncharacterized protein LCP9604111_7263 [Penicillium roqueforti]CDM29149.1 Nicotinamide N-methyltransferase-like [Penicillium roqueforti FM164]KAF9244310.1 hypothetical protein LCP9604111_7263 [Penicillium roqueforti]KAI1835891.1 hypothetical protein CBS147337_3040 [Penicillium roqueforti]KAI2678279.1 hypothetical protein LCP963914a_7710 [Penicillium roqueforti]KAI2682913.1 hypothetical protein CBS147355_2053 [Penicillium roqueforti]
MTDSIDKLAAQYFQLVELQQLDLPPGPVLIQPAVQTALYERMFNENAVFPVPPDRYRSRVLKQLISRIEESIINPEEDEINDDLMESWSTLVSQPKPSALQQAQQLSLVKYTAPTSSAGNCPKRTVTTSESRGVILYAGTTGNRTWEAALHLGSFLASEAGEALVRGKRVIELGAGTGFLSFLCARHLGVRSIVATDREPALVDNIRACVKHNLHGRESIPIYPAVWEWGTPLEKVGDLAGLGSDEGEEGTGLKFDVALGADLVYDTDLVPSLLSTVQDLFENYNIEEFITAVSLRNENTFRTFLNACETNSLAFEALPFESTPAEDQTGFFHSTSIPLRTYRISRSK